MTFITILNDKLKDCSYLFKSLLKGIIPDKYRGACPLLFYLYDSIKLHYISKNVSTIYGSTNIDYSIDDAIVLCLVKNGEFWINDFIEHYKKMGFKHIIFLDNGSTDITIEIGRKHKNVTFLRTNIPFKENNILLRRYLVKQFAKKRWSLTVDIDELWDYPFSDKLSLKELLRYLRKKGANAVVTQMLDMFMSTIPHKKYKLKEYKYYDISNIKKENLTAFSVLHKCGFKAKKVLNSNIPFLTGGIRGKIFELDNIWLTKMPLIYYDNTIHPISHQHFSNNAVIADISTVLLHYKFIHIFKSKIKEALEKKQYLDNSKEYKKYNHILKKKSNIVLKQNTAKKITSISQLIDDDFLHISKKYKKLLNTDRASIEK